MEDEGKQKSLVTHSILQFRTPKQKHGYVLSSINSVTELINSQVKRKINAGRSNTRAKTIQQYKLTKAVLRVKKNQCPANLRLKRRAECL